MAQYLSYQVSVMFASLVGAAGFILAVQAWLRFRGSPFGRMLSVLPVFMLIIAVYHPMLMMFPEYIQIALLMESIGFILLIVFVALSIQIHRRMSRATRFDP